jgi:4-hydroxybenzoate polyprenyltransferase/phosphoserine phosphatase
VSHRFKSFDWGTIAAASTIVSLSRASSAETFCCDAKFTPYFNGVELATEPPLVVDLDGTLLRTDLLLETALIFLRDRPLRFFSLISWLFTGKAKLKHELALVARLDVTRLPYNECLVEFIRKERERGRRVVLATASTSSLANAVASHSSLFDQVIASNTTANLSAQSKRDVLVQAFGEKGFDYAGNAVDDLPVWAAARRAYVVNARPSVLHRARALGNVTEVIPAPHVALSDWRQALRLHQWLKNLLIFVPLFAAHRGSELPLLQSALIAFLCFSLCASSAYVLNDLLDLQDDRYHAHKRLRPFAAGRLSIQTGLLLFPILASAAFALAVWLLPLAAAALLLFYYVVTIAYSLWLKRQTVVDVMTLTALYTLRLVVGGVALGIVLSFWLLAFSMFMFFSLALVKRYAELFQLRARGTLTQTRGRGYFSDDLPMLASLGAAAGYSAVLVLALYINDARTTQLYSQPQLIWFACPVLLAWISRVWMLTHRGQMNEDPVLFAVQDRVSLGMGAAIALIFWAAK